MLDTPTLVQHLKSPPGEARTYWHRSMRLVMSLRTRGEEVDWSTADLSVTDEPVTPDEWQAWLRTEPANVSQMVDLLELESPRPGIPDYAEVLRFVLDEVPVLAHRFLVYHDNPVRRAIEEAQGARLGDAARGHGHVAWDRVGPGLLGAWLSHRVLHEEPFNPHSVGSALDRRFDVLPEPLAAVYPAVVLKTIKAIRKNDLDQVHLRSDWLDAPSILAVLKAIRTKPAQLDTVMAILVDQGTPAGLEAMAELLLDAKAGQSALLWLAAAGRPGARAAHARWSSAKGAKGAAARESLARLDALPVGDPPKSGPRHLLTSDLSPWQPAPPVLPSDPSTPALDRERLLAMCSGWGAPKAEREDLSAEAWADYLQVASMDDHLVHPGPTWDRARELGRLGRGADPRFLLAAAQRMNPRGRTHWNRDSKIGWGHLLLWAGADRDTYVGAMALALRDGSLRSTMGWIDDHWEAPLEQARPAWTDQVLDWIRRLRQGRPMLGPVDERPRAETVEWDPRRHALVGTVPAGGRARLTLGQQDLELRPSDGSMTLSGPSQGERRYPPTEGPLPIVLNRTEDALLLSLGSVTWGQLPLPSLGEAAGLERVELRREATPLWHALRVLLQGEAHGAAWLADDGSDAAARLLALLAELRPDTQAKAVDAALARLGDHAAPYLAALGKHVELPSLPDRTFDEVLEALAAHTGRNVRHEGQWSWAAGHGLRGGGLVGPVLRLLPATGTKGELPSAARMVELCEECPLYPYGDAPRDLGVRDDLGLREATWLLVPPEGGFGNGPLFYQLHAAAWPVRGGHALALWSGYDVPSIHWLLGLPFMPVASWSAAEPSRLPGRGRGR